jgi:hypothetical protein
MIKYFNKLLKVKANNGDERQTQIKFNFDHSNSDSRSDNGAFFRKSSHYRASYLIDRSTESRPNLPLKSRIVKLILTNSLSSPTEKRISSPRPCVPLDPSDDRYQQDELDSPIKEMDNVDENYFFGTVYSPNESESVTVTCDEDRSSTREEPVLRNKTRSRSSSKRKMISEDAKSKSRSSKSNSRRSKSGSSRFKACLNINSTGADHDSSGQDFGFDSNDLDYYCRNYSKNVPPINAPPCQDISSKVI